MSYHPLSNDSGSDADNRRSEADRIIAMLKDTFEGGEMTEREGYFYEDIKSGPVSVKQLFWLRDIKEKYCG